MTKLSVNLNKVALLRNQRDLPYPSVLEAARMAIRAGAESITVHPRPDERHIRNSDVRDLAALLRSEYDDSIEFNIEGNPTSGFLDLVSRVKPTQVTLVPDAPDARTSDRGWDIRAHLDLLGETVKRLKEHDARVSIFVDADVRVIPPAKAVGADRIELFTGPYSAAFGTPVEDAELRKCQRTAEAVWDHGLGLNAGHDLTLQNLAKLIEAIPWIDEVSIGHALTADALRFGYAGAVSKYVSVLKPAIQIQVASSDTNGAGARPDRPAADDRGARRVGPSAGRFRREM